MRIRSSRPACSSTRRSASPGLSRVTAATLCPAARSASTLGNGTFSSARKRTRADRCVLRYAASYNMERLVAGDLGRVGEDGAQSLWSELGIAREDLLLSPAGREKPEHEIDREPSVAYDRLTCENFGVGRNVRVPGHSISVSRVAAI